jgi:Plasmid pRiA4b ORF-3-like protein
LIVRVVLRGHVGERLDDAPGRDLLARSGHSFAQLARAIDTAFARWDLGHLHEFSLSDGRRIGIADADESGADGALDEATETIGAASLKVGDTFEYVFDLGDSWEHDCTVLRVNVDAQNELGTAPRDIVPVFGWGAIPDQYGRIEPETDESDE